MYSLKSYFSLVILAALISLLTACGGAESRKAEYMEQAEESFAAQDYDKAKLGYKNAIQIDPKDAEPRIGLAKVLVATQSWREAAAQYKGALQADPENTEAAIELGKLLLLARGSDQALEQAEKVLLKDPSNIDALTLKAAVSAQQGKRGEALASLEKGYKTNPSHHDQAVLYSTLLMETQQYDTAMDVLASALENSGKPNDLLSLRARLFDQLDEVDSAVKDYEALVSENTSEFVHKQKLVSYLVQKGRMQDAIAKLETYISDDEVSIEPRKALVDLLVGQKKYDEAEEKLIAYVKAFPEEQEFATGIGRLKLIRGDIPGAVKQFESVVAADKGKPAAVVAQVELAKIDVSKGDKAGALVRLSDVLLENPNNSESLLLRGQLYISQNNYVDAINDFRTALNNQPDNPVVMKLLASAHRAANELALAENYIKQLVRRFPSDLALKNDLASVFGAMGKSEQAIEVRQSIQLAQPTNSINLTELANLYSRTGRVNELHSVADMLEGIPSSKSAGLYFKGLSLQMQSKHTDAISFFDKAIANTPEAIEPMSAKVKSLIALNKNAEAIDWLNTLIEEGVNVSLASNFRGEIELLEQKIDSAKKSFSESINHNKEWITPRKNLALAYRANGKIEEAISVLEEAIAEVPGAILLRTELAQLLEASKDVDGAIAQYEILMEKVGAPLAANNLAMLLVTYKQDEASLERAATVAETLRGSTNPMFMDTLGWVYFKRAQIDLALPLIREAASRAPEVAQINYHLALAYNEKQNSEAAIEYLEKALSTGDSFIGKSNAETLLKALKQSRS